MLLCLETSPNLARSFPIACILTERTTFVSKGYRLGPVSNMSWSEVPKVVRAEASNTTLSSVQVLEALTTL